MFGKEARSVLTGELIGGHKKMKSQILSLLSAGLLGISAAASATPITYTFTVFGLPATNSPLSPGTLGAVAFGGTTNGNDVLTYTFVGDTSNVLSFSSPVSGHEILLGTASVTVSDPTTNSILAHGTFLAADDMFVSIDNSNGGIGFGSAGLPPTATNFPGEVHYPFGFVPFLSGVRDPAVATYGLTSNITFDGSTYASQGSACVGFPFSNCSGTLSLPTTAGDLTLTGDLVDAATFTAVVGSTTSVPEPAALWLLGLGLTAVGFARRKRGCEDRLRR